MRISASRNHVWVEHARIDAQELRSYLLFWDVLDFPANNILHIGLDPDAEFLVDEGILQRTEARFIGSGGMGQLLRDAHLAVYRDLDAQEPGMWSIASGERSLSFLDEDIEEGRGALVRLYNAVPVPNKDVPLAEVLEFRTKRRAELLSFRQHMEDVYQKVLTVGDGPLAWNTEVERLQSSIEDQIQVSKEAPFRFRLSDLSAGLNLATVGAGVIAAHALDQPLLGGALQGLAAGITLNVGGALKKKAASPVPFKYVTSYHAELF